MRLIGKLAGSAFFWFAVFLLALELAAGQLVPYAIHPTADAVPRNPTFHRGWPEYLDVDDGDDSRPLVVLLTNSQGVGGEVADGERIYAAHLRRALAAGDPPARLENWASGGIRTPEIELLSMRAIERRATVVLGVFAYRNFDPPAILNLDFPFSDITLFAGKPTLWRYLDDTTFAESITIEGLLSRSAQLGSDLARSRIPMTDALTSPAPRAWHRWIAGREIRPGPRLDALTDDELSIYWMRNRSLEERLATNQQRRHAMEHVDPRDAAVRLATFERFFEQLHRRLSAAGIRLTWVWQPTNPATLRGRSRALYREFLARATAAVRRTGTPCVDLLDAVAPEHFVTPGHFDEDGHRELAERLLPVMRDELQ